MKGMTYRQADRQHSRDVKTGRYTQHIACELCGRNVGERYFSDDRCNSTSLGLVLHAKCCAALAVLPTEAYVAMLEKAGSLPAAARLRLVATILEIEAKSRSGCVDLHFCRRGAGPLVGVYRNSESGMESDPATPWTVVCELHTTCVCCETKALAMSTAADTCNFCDDCREAAGDKMANRTKRDRWGEP